MVQQYPNTYGHPETFLRLPHTKDDPTLHVENCPVGLAITGPVAQVKVGLSCYNVIDLGDPPYIDWEVETGVEDTEDEDYDAGTPLYVPITRGGMEDIRAKSYITKVDERVNGYPGSFPIEEINLNELGERNHGDLTGVDRNQHHHQAHDHNNPLDGNSLYPKLLHVMEAFAMRGVAVIPQITGTMNNWAPIEGVGYTIWLVSSNAEQHITGFSVGQVQGRLLILINVGTQNIVLDHNNVSGSAFANRLKVKGQANLTMGPDGIAQAVWAGDPATASQQWHVW